MKINSSSPVFSSATSGSSWLWWVRNNDKKVTPWPDIRVQVARTRIPSTETVTVIQVTYPSSMSILTTSCQPSSCGSVLLIKLTWLSADSVSSFLSSSRPEEESNKTLENRNISSDSALLRDILTICCELPPLCPSVGKAVAVTGGTVEGGSGMDLPSCRFTLT